MKRNRQEQSKGNALGDRKIAIYSRKSKFTGKGESVENQITVCREYIHLHFGDVPEEDILEFEDEGFSGKDTQRPQFQKMVAACERKEIGLIICYRLDRFSRKTLDFLRISETLEKHDVSFVSVRDNFDTTSHTGRAMMTMVAVFAELERETLRERICDNLIELAKSGRWLGGTAPTGYEAQAVSKEDKGGSKRTSYHLTLIPEEADIVKLLFRKFLETNSVVAVDTYCIQNGIKTKNDKNYSRFTIKSILQNPVYMVADADAYHYFTSQGVEIFAEEAAFDGTYGMMVYNKTSQTKGKTHEQLPMEEWVIAIGCHEGIISGADWAKVQRMLNKNKEKSYRKPKSNEALLSGLLYCGKCGAYMRPKAINRKNEDGKRMYFSYLCETKERSKGKCCNMKRPSGNKLDEDVCKEIIALADNPQAFALDFERYKQKLEANTAVYADETKQITEAIATIDRSIQKLVRSIAEEDDDSISSGYYQQQIAEYHAQRKELEQRLEEIKSITRSDVAPEDEVGLMVDSLQSFAKTFERATLTEKYETLRRFIRRVEYHSDNDVRLYLFGHDEGFEPPEDDGPDSDDHSGDGGGGGNWDGEDGLEPIRGGGFCNHPPVARICSL